jgi:hypothetical protein
MALKSGLSASVTTSRFGSDTISGDFKGGATHGTALWQRHDQPQQFGGFSDHLALSERLYDLAEQRALRGGDLGGAGCP